MITIGTYVNSCLSDERLILLQLGWISYIRWGTSKSLYRSMKTRNPLQVAFSVLPQEYEILFSPLILFHWAFCEQLATALGLAVTSEIADSVSKAYNNKHPELDSQSPEVLMIGFRTAGWTCFASTLLSIFVVIVGLRDLGIIGKKTCADEDAEKSDGSRARVTGSLPSKKEHCFAQVWRIGISFVLYSIQ